MSGLSNELDQKNVFLLLYIYMFVFESSRRIFKMRDNDDDDNNKK
jgi:hypothetical protein